MLGRSLYSSLLSPQRISFPNSLSALENFQLILSDHQPHKDQIYSFSCQVEAGPYMLWTAAVTFFANSAFDRGSHYQENQPMLTPRPLSKHSKLKYPHPTSPWFGFATSFELASRLCICGRIPPDIKHNGMQTHVHNFKISITQVYQVPSFSACPCTSIQHHKRRQRWINSEVCSHNIGKRACQVDVRCQERSWVHGLPESKEAIYVGVYEEAKFN